MLSDEKPEEEGNGALKLPLISNCERSSIMSSNNTTQREHHHPSHRSKSGVVHMAIYPF